MQEDKVHLTSLNIDPQAVGKELSHNVPRTGREAEGERGERKVGKESDEREGEM